ncbi:MAG TPA: X-Pro aminopeptidase [Alphaproteobacteria bacterium]|jgi:Xaa-Pro aminopeptidase|nr:X-Pro aminopeptidase [Alphaproteobacteria bacterium]
MDMIPTFAELGERLTRLRSELQRRGLAGFVIPRADAHQGEYVPPHDARLAWITGFTGSAGTAVILRDKAAIFVDGRYTLQVRNEVDVNLLTPVAIMETSPEDWIAQNLKGGERLGYDPWLHTPDGVSRLKTACGRCGAAPEAVAVNPVDAVWTDQPAPPTAPIVPHPLEYAGETSEAKRARIAAKIAENSADAAMLTLPDSIAWLFNIRGGDVTHSPLPLSFAILDADGKARLFCDPAKISDGLTAHLGEEVRLEPPSALGPALDAMGAAKRRVLLDPGTCASWITSRLEAAGAKSVFGADPCVLPKALKNPVEITGMRNAHLRDGAALSRFLAWLDERAARGGLDEISAAEKLAEFRAATGRLKDLSFPTISGAGPNGAIVHYRANAESNRVLEAGQLYLLDSGAQYLDGTTDVTRTIAIGDPSAEQRDRFTRVLKGHISLATIKFPRGVTGAHLDVLARAALWKAGLDYDHGTGHGVGAYLSVHEGPQNISRRPGQVALQPGMIVSNEPGYYKQGAFGIRIENLVLVQAPQMIAGGEREMMGFETLTLAPIDLRLVERALLSDEEAGWLNAYHAEVREKLSPLVDAQTAAWLAQSARAI